jgi:hypothetical protein
MTDEQPEALPSELVAIAENDVDALAGALTKKPVAKSAAVPVAAGLPEQSVLP